MTENTAFGVLILFAVFVPSPIQEFAITAACLGWCFYTVLKDK